MRAGGRGGCNNSFTQAMINGESIRFSAVAATQMACVSTEATLQEERFFSALGEARFWQMRDERLVLLDAGGRELVLMARSAI